MLALPKKLIRKSLDLMGLEIRRKEQRSNRTTRATMLHCLRQALQNGLKPETVIDVGAASGTPALYSVFPEAKHILIEPLEEFVPHLDSLVDRLNAEYIIAAAGRQPGSIVINVHPDLVGSSIYREEEESDVNGIERTVSVVTLDGVCKDKGAAGPYLIKIDTQGAELDVLGGAEEVLKQTEFVILEVSLFEFFNGGPQLFDCIRFMEERGFIAYDIFDLQYRLLDGAMSQADVAFVKEKSVFRERHFYATEEQREKQNKQIVKFLK